MLGAASSQTMGFSYPPLSIVSQDRVAKVISQGAKAFERGGFPFEVQQLDSADAELCVVHVWGIIGADRYDRVVTGREPQPGALDGRRPRFALREGLGTAPQGVVSEAAFGEVFDQLVIGLDGVSLIAMGGIDARDLKQ